jgi:prepilin-type N-terminal cleavage/methylation domain-containing protein
LQIDGRRRGRRGITLVELLVTISILVILMAVAARMMNFSVEDRRTREAAREINVFLGSARARAMETGRPCGVMLRRLENQPLCVVGLDQAEVPPPYAGDTLDAVARVQMPTLADGSPVFWPDGLRKAVAVCTSFSAPLVHVGDLVQFNYQGPFCTIRGPDADAPGTPGHGVVDSATLDLAVDLREGQILPWPSAPGLSPAMPYQIVRQPRKSAAPGLQLPLRAVIDLEFSGTDDHSIGAATNSPVYIMFSPTGSLERIYHPGHPHGDIHPGSEPIYLLVGKQERVPAGAAEDGLANWQDVKNLWVTISPQTGMGTTAEMASVDPTIRDPAVGVPLARAIAREGQSMGGR